MSIELDIVDTLSECGYAVVANAIDTRAISEVRTWLQGEAAAARARLAALRERADAAGTPLDEEGSALFSGNFPGRVKGSPLLWRLLADSPPLLAALRAVLRSDRLYLHMYPSPRFIDPGNDAAGVPTHVDRQYNSHLSDFVTVWVPIDCFEAHVGGVAVHARSHHGKTAWRDVPRLSSNLWFEAIPSTGGGELLVLRPGDALLIHPDTLHASGLNRSEKTRLSCDFRVFGRHDTTTKHYLDLTLQQVFEPGTGERHV